jgi:phage-related protein (TIGR01555 family)
MDDSEVRQDGVLVNALTGMGLQQDRGQYTDIANPKFLSELELDSLYINSWLCRRVVDVVASEATRNGWDIALGDDTKKARKQSDDLIAAGEKLRIRKHLAYAIQMARLHGGAAIILLTDEGGGQQKLDQPLRKNRLKSIKGMHVLDCWRIWPAPGWSGVGQPDLYQFNTQRDGELRQYGLADLEQVTIHSTRLLRIEGESIPWRYKSHFKWWGVSVLQPLWEVFKRYETGQTSAAALLHDFDQFIHKIPGLGGMITAGNQDAITRRLELNQMARSVYRGLVLDANEEASFISRSAAGISDILDRLVQEVTGASKLPHTKLWGESPSGLGATGRSEDRAFAQDIAEYQEDVLQEPLRQFYETLMMCSEGPYTGEPPEDWRVQFRPTFVMTDEETAALRQAVAAADSQYINAGVLAPNEVALARFGRAEFSLDTTLIDREPDGSIKQDEEQMAPEFGGDFGQFDEGEDAGADQAQGAGATPAAAPGAAGPDGRETTDAADEPCCDACARGEECEDDCPAQDGEDCGCEHSDESQDDDPARHRHPDKVGQVMHRWKHGTLHSGTGRKGEHRGPVGYPGGQKQAIAIALSIAGKGNRKRGKTRTVRTDAVCLPARLKVAGLVVDTRIDGTGRLVGPYGQPTSYEAVVGQGDSGIWEVMDSETGEWLAVVGVADRRLLEQAAPGAKIRPLSSLDLAAMGIRCDAYSEE